MTTNTNLSYEIAAAGLIRAIEECINAKPSPLYPTELDNFLGRLDDLVYALTVIKNDWHQLRNEEAELARQSAKTKFTTTEPDTESIF